jgi:vacuolar protein sorting-associated protein 13A/C
MFERKFKALILKFLGEFIEDFDDNDLRVDNWSGQVTQTRLNLRPGSLRFLSMVLGIDLRVVRGVIGSLQISFNWRSLWKEAIKLTLEDLYIVARPNTPPDPFIFLATRRNKKRARIEELLLKTKIENPNKTYFQQLEATIADNLCVSLKNVHIRFEDTVSNQFRPFVIGFTLDKLNYSPADSNWKKSFVTLESKKQAGKSFMVLELSQLSVYHISKCTELFSTKSEWLQGLSNDKFASLMYPYIAHRDYTPQISEYYILRPLNAEIRIRISLKSVIDLDIPKLSVSILIEEIACALEANQYQDLLMLGSIMSLHKAIGVNIHLRPVLRPKARTRDWWIYLLSVIKQKVKKKIFPLTWEYLNIRKCNKIEYIQTYQHILAKEYEIEYGRSIGNFQKISGLSNLSIKELENKLLVVEDFHTVEEIYLFRSVAQREMLLLKDSKRKGWIEWGRGWFTSNSAEEENFLKSLVEYFELINTDQKGSADYTKSFINFELKKCSISLEGRHVNGTRASFLKISLYQAIIHRIMTTESTRIFSALISLKIIDPFTPIDKFRKLFNPKNTDESILENIPSFEIEEEIFPVENDGFPDFATQELKITPLFQLVFDATKSKDMSLKVLLQPLEFVYNKFCIERINGFLKIPEALALYESIEIQTMNHLANWKLKTQARLDFLLKNQMKINIDVNISAPLIIIPENTMNEDTSEILLNTGDLRITSKPRDYSEVTYKNRKNSDIDDETFYDHFDIQISDISVSLLPPESIVPWNIIEKFNISMQASKSIIPKDPHLTTLKLKGEIQSLTARLSKMQYLLLQQYSFNTEEAKQEPLVEYKFPAIIDDPEDEFFDAPDPYEDIVTENIKHPYNKEHFRIEFSFNSMNLIITDESEDKDILTVTAKDLVVGASQEESRNVFALKLGYVLVKDWIEKRALVQSNQETSDLIIMDFNKYFDNHPDYIQQNFHTTFSVHLSDLHINYCDGNV